MLHRLPPHPYPILGVLIIVLILVAGGVTLCVRPTPQTGACTQTLSPGDNGVQAWLAAAQPGQTLCLQPGVYTGAANMLSIPDTFAGTATQPITIQAATDGTVLLDGQDSRRPLHTRGRYGVIRGVNVRQGDNQNVFIGGSFWLLQRLVSWDTGVGGDANIHMSGTDNTLEDCAAFGPARKPIAIGAAGGERNTIRRCYTRWAANDHPTSNPSVSLEVGYGQNTATVENSITTWDTTGRVTEPEGLGELFSTRGSKWLGSIFLVEKSDTYSPYVLMRAYTDAGSHAQQGKFNPTSNLVFKHILAYIDPAHPKFSEVRALYFAESTTSGAPPGTGNVLSHLVSVSGLAPQFSSRSFPATDVQHGPTLAAAIGEGKSVFVDSVAAPGICHEYRNGVLTDTPLWPWKMESRIVEAMTQAGMEPVHVTQTIEAHFGPIPAACTRGSTPPIPPEPGPTPPVASAMTCTGDLLASGKLQMSCVPQTRR